MAHFVARDQRATRTDEPDEPTNLTKFTNQL
jgi:hypothetical protein